MDYKLGPKQYELLESMAADPDMRVESRVGQVLRVYTGGNFHVALYQRYANLNFGRLIADGLVQEEDVIRNWFVISATGRRYLAENPAPEKPGPNVKTQLMAVVTEMRGLLSVGYSARDVRLQELVAAARELVERL